MSCEGDNVCHINALLRHQFPSLLYTDKTYYNVLNASRFKKTQYLHLRSIIVVYMCIELCVTQTFITQPYFRKQFPVHKPKVPSSRFFFTFIPLAIPCNFLINIAITGANLVIKGVVCKDAAWVCLFNQIRPFPKWNMQEKIKYSSEISVFKQEWLCETFLFVLIIVHLIVKKIMKIRHILVFRFKKNRQNDLFVRKDSDKRAMDHL